jgi:hypothetical protein
VVALPVPLRRKVLQLASQLLQAYVCELRADGLLLLLVLLLFLFLFLLLFLMLLSCTAAACWHAAAHGSAVLQPAVLRMAGWVPGWKMMLHV